MQPARLGPTQRRHAITVIVIWLVLTAAAELAVYQVRMPPGDLSIQAEDQAKTLTFLTLLGIPVFVGVVVFMAYCIFAFRQPPETAELVSGPPLYGNVRVQVGWVVISGLLVLLLAVYGTLTLASSEAAKAAGVPGRAVNSTNATEAPGATGGAGNLVVQVIGQQWYFTYRYPSAGGLETTHLELPVNTRVEFHVTSLDVIHSFWAYELGVKADAVPGNDNLAYATTKGSGPFQVRCGELCGLWHGEMEDGSGQVVSSSDFQAWISREQSFYADIKQFLPKYGPLYYPSPLTKGT